MLISFIGYICFNNMNPHMNENLYLSNLLDRLKITKNHTEIENNIRDRKRGDLFGRE